jgi:osmotically-inducible protein OsmY
MRSDLKTLGALGIGAVAMYLLDPDRGRRRRAILRDKAIRYATAVEEAAGTTARDLANRTRGVWHEAASRFRDGEPVDDDVLVDRVRSRIGHVTSHPRAIDVSCAEGEVTLRGDVLEGERTRLLATVASTDGVAAVNDELDEELDDAPDYAR